MKASWVAKVIEEVYNQGHVKSGAQKLDYKDFLQMVIMAKAAALENRAREERLLGQFLQLNNMLNSYQLEVKKDKYGRKYVEWPQNLDIVELPGYLGVFSLTPISKDNVFSCSPIIRIPPGSEWLYCNNDSGLAAFAPYRDKAYLFNLDDCIKEVDAALVTNDEDSNMSEAIAWQVCKDVWQQVFRTITLPIDKRTDGNPNPDEIFKTKLSSPELNG